MIEEVHTLALRCFFGASLLLLSRLRSFPWPMLQPSWRRETLYAIFQMGGQSYFGFWPHHAVRPFGSSTSEVMRLTRATEHASPANPGGLLCQITQQVKTIARLCRYG